MTASGASIKKSSKKAVHSRLRATYIAHTAHVSVSAQRGAALEGDYIMYTLDNLTLDQIKALHPDCYVESFDMGQLETSEGNVKALDVIVWASESAADEGPSGENAVARYTIRA